MASPTWNPSTYTTGYTNLGSLGPTSFPSDCLRSLWDFQTSPVGAYSYQTQGCAISTCCPSQRFYTDDFAWMTSYFSPGVCPSQYRSCSPPPATAPTVLSSQPGETVVFCCPTNYACPYTVPASGEPSFWFCQSLMSSSTTRVVVMDDIFDQSTVSTRGFTMPTAYTAEYQIAFPIQIRMGGDPSSPTSSGGSSRTGPQGPADTSSSTDSSDDTSSAGGGGGGTSSSRKSRTGTKIGIAVGVAAGALLLAALVSYFVRRRKLQQKPAQVSQIDPGQPGGVYEVQGQGLHSQPPELSNEKFKPHPNSTAQPVPVYELH